MCKAFGGRYYHARAPELEGKVKGVAWGRDGGPPIYNFGKT